MIKQLKIGLTGGIGSGKTTVAKIFLSMGYPVYFADQRAKFLMVHDVELIHNLKKTFGDDIYSDNVLNRAKLGAIVFNDKSKLQSLNDLVHPAVGKDFLKWSLR